MSWGWVVAAIVISYGLGTVPGARIVARHHGVDLFSTGDGNPGAWNALEQLGWRRAWPVFAIDGLKGLLAAALGWLVLGAGPLGDAAGSRLGIATGASGDGAGLLAWLPWSGVGALGLDAWLPWACVAAAMLGHGFPLPHPGRGGKSVMTFGGGAIGLVPIVGLPLLVVFLAGIAARRAGPAARLVIFAFPFAQAATTPLLQVAWTGALMSLFGLLYLVRRGDRRTTTDPGSSPSPSPSPGAGGQPGAGAGR